MATVVDRSGNNPHGPTFKDYAIACDSEMPGVEFKGAEHALTLGAASVATPPVSHQCRFVRIAPEGHCHYAIGYNPTAVQGQTRFLAAGSVETIPIRGHQRVAVIQDSDETNIVTISEDR